MSVVFELDIEEANEIRDEAVKLLCEYIKVDTSNPPGDIDSGLKYLRDIFESEGIEYKVFESETNKKSIFAWVKGNESSKKPLLLLNHMDVVPADRTHWTFDPFCGEVKGGYILGRGTLDMKGMAIAQLMCLVIAKRKNLVLSRDLMFLAVPDEETGGFEGAKYVVEHHLHEIDPEVVLDEGGFGTKQLTDENPVFFVACGQKKGVWLRIRAHGQAGHGSQPHKENPNDILIKALNKVLTHPYNVDLHKNIWHALKKLARERSPLEGLIVNIYKVPFISYFIGKYFEKYEFFNALVRNTLTITMLDSGTKVNVIPTIAEATIDCRVLPHIKVEDVLNRLKRIINDPRIEVEIIKELKEAQTSSFYSDFILTMEDVLQTNFKGAKVLPYITPVGTDAKYFREKGVKAYGIFPVFVNGEDLKMFHGNDERISIENFGIGCKIIYELFVNYCT